MTQLCDLGPGFHLVPVRDHDRITVAPWRVIATDTTGWEAPYSQRFEDQAAAVRWLRGDTAAWLRADGFKLRLQPPRARAGEGRAHKRRMAQHRERMAEWYDPMALQAIVILRGVLADLRAA